MEMTAYQKNFVNSIIDTAKVDKAYAQWCISDFQRVDPYNLGNLKELVKQEVIRRKSLETTQNETSILPSEPDS